MLKGKFLEFVGRTQKCLICIFDPEIQEISSLTNIREVEVSKDKTFRYLISIIKNNNDRNKADAH